MTRIMFHCVENACRSQMAEGFARYYGEEDIEASSGGSKPADQVNGNAVKVMREKGIDISRQEPKSVTVEDMEKSDYVVTMGCGVDICAVCSNSFVPEGADSPFSVEGETIEWDIDDPAGKSIEEFRRIRDEIEEKVRNLIGEVTGNP